MIALFVEYETKLIKVKFPVNTDLRFEFNIHNDIDLNLPCREPHIASKLKPK